jgi:hypothetical protein
MYTVGVKYVRSYLPHRTIFLTGATLICVVGLGILAYSNTHLPDVVVTRTANGFVPATITIKKGQVVIFKSSADKEFWPASDFHPTHTLYPEFDPKRPLKPDESWRFVFAKAGVWTYHDHLSPDVRGTVIVLGAPGESAQACLSHVATSSADTSNCWAADMTETLQTKGLQAAFDMFASLYKNSPSFRGLNCHDAGHILGAAAYKEYSDNHTVIDRPETSYCGYGFYHGFMEAMLVDQGPSQYGKVRDYCDALKTNGHLNNPSGACYHGIGHAAFDSISGDLWGNADNMVQAALDVCEKAALGAPERAQCSTGVFNALAIAESAHSYDLAFQKTDPMSICRAQKQQYQEGCYQELGIGVIRQDNLDRAASVAFIESFGNADAVAATLLGYAADEVKRSITSIDLPAFHSFCASFASAQNQLACNHGVLSGLREAGEPGKEYQKMFDYCALYEKGAARTECYSFSITQTKSIASSAADFQRACLAIDEPSILGMCN